jgi:hypothetical protein
VLPLLHFSLLVNITTKMVTFMRYFLILITFYWCITTASHQNTPIEMTFLFLVNCIKLGIIIQRAYDATEDFDFLRITQSKVNVTRVISLCTHTCNITNCASHLKQYIILCYEFKISAKVDLLFTSYL